MATLEAGLRHRTKHLKPVTEPQVMLFGHVNQLHQQPSGRHRSQALTGGHTPLQVSSGCAPWWSSVKARLNSAGRGEPAARTSNQQQDDSASSAARNSAARDAAAAARRSGTGHSSWDCDGAV